MAQVTAEMIKWTAREMHAYEISDREANTLAATIGALLTLSRQLRDIGLSSLEPPLGYPTLCAEAERLAKGEK